MKYVLWLKIGKHLFSYFKDSICLEKGDSIAPLLFNVLLEIVIRRSQAETQGMILDRCSQIMAMLMMWLLQEEGFKMLKKYLHHCSNKPIRWD